MPSKNSVSLRAAATRLIEPLELYRDTFPERLGKQEVSELLQQDRRDLDDLKDAIRIIRGIRDGKYAAATGDIAYLSGDLIKLLNYGEAYCLQRTDPAQREPAFDLIATFAEEYKEVILRQAVTLECNHLLGKNKRGGVEITGERADKIKKDVAERLKSGVIRFRNKPFDPLAIVNYK